jgi:hypothetical protein
LDAVGGFSGAVERNGDQPQHKVAVLHAHRPFIGTILGSASIADRANRCLMQRIGDLGALQNGRDLFGRIVKRRQQRKARAGGKAKQQGNTEHGKPLDEAKPGDRFAKPRSKPARRQSALLGGGTWPPVQEFRGSIAYLRAVLRVSAAVAGCFAKAGAWRRTRGFDAATKARKGLR